MHAGVRLVGDRGHLLDAQSEHAGDLLRRLAQRLQLEDLLRIHTRLRRLRLLGGDGHRLRRGRRLSGLHGAAAPRVHEPLLRGLRRLLHDGLWLAHGHVGERLVLDRVLHDLRRLHAVLRRPVAGEHGREPVARLDVAGLVQAGAADRVQPGATLLAPPLDVHGPIPVVILHVRVGDTRVDDDQHLQLGASVLPECGLFGVEVAHLVGGDLLDDPADPVARPLELRSLAGLALDLVEHLAGAHPRLLWLRHGLPVLLHRLRLAIAVVSVVLRLLSEHYRFLSVVVSVIVTVLGIRGR